MEAVPASITLLDADPDLLGDAWERHPLRGHELQLLELPAGTWRPPRNGGVPHLGYLVVDGSIARRIAVSPQYRAELLGPGDLIRPFADDDEPNCAELTVDWRVIVPTRVAALDDEFLRSASVFPDMLVALTVRGVARARRLGLQMAMADLRPVEQRVKALFGQLARRWGRVTKQGLVVPMPLSHAVVGELVGARRPTVTTALGRLERSGQIVRIVDDSWLVDRACLGAALQVLS